MQRVKNGDLVQVNFTGRFIDGRVFGTSIGDAAVELRLGDPAVVPGLQKALMGMTPGESKSVLIPVAEAFGPRKQEYIMHIDAMTLPTEVLPQVGETLELQSDGGTRLMARVVGVTAEEITLDANHPLAGHDLAFDIDLLRIGAPEPAN